MEVLPDSVSMALRCLIEHRPADFQSDEASSAASGCGKNSTFRFAIVPGNVTAADLLRFVLHHLDLKANPADCCAQVLLPHWRCLSLSEICEQPETTSAFSLLAQISNIAVLRIILPSVQESGVLPSSVMRNLLKSLVPQHACDTATQVSWFRQAGCPLSDALIAEFLASPDDFEFTFRARRDFSDWHSRVCLQYLEQVSRGCQQPQQQLHLAATGGGIFALISSPQQQLPQPPPLGGCLIIDEDGQSEVPDAAESAAEDGEEPRGSGTAACTVSALGRLTEHFRDRSSASRKRLKAARAASAAVAASSAASSSSSAVPEQVEFGGGSINNNHSGSSNDKDPNCIFVRSSPELLQAASVAAAPSPGDKRRRTRVFIDPATEIPQLEAWFAQESHPTSAQFAQFARDLNGMPFRQKQPLLEAKNVQLWFKNHRAKVKRERLDLPLALRVASASPSSSAEDSTAPQTAAAEAAAGDAEDVGEEAGDGELRLAMSEDESADGAAAAAGSELLGVSQLESPV